MRRLSFCTLFSPFVVIALASTLVLAKTETAATLPVKDAKQGIMRIGLTASLFRDMPDALLQIVMKPFSAVMEQQTGMSGSLVSVKDARLLAQQMESNNLQLGVFHSHEFAALQVKHPGLTPLVFAVNSKQPLESMLVVRRDKKLNAPADIAGKTIVMPSTVREFSLVFANRRCSVLGRPLRNYCKLVGVNDSEDALDQVVDGQADGAIVERHQLDNYKDDKPGRANNLVVALNSESFPPAIIAFIPANLKKDSVERFRTGMISAKKNPRAADLLKLIRLTSFESIPDSFDKTLTQLAKDYPFEAADKK